MTAETSADPLVIVRREGAATRITLNRPRALNALTREMVVFVHEAVRAAAEDGSTAVLLDGVGERGFCGGGDVKAMVAGGLEASLAFLQDEYRADHAIGVSPVPVVGVMDGITMGGGIGLTGHAAVRIVTERSRLAMPESRIGIVPDVGGGLLLASAPGRLGEALAAASGGMGPGDAVALGFADLFVPSERLGRLRELLVEGQDPGSAAAGLAEPAPDSPVLAWREWLDPIADRALGQAEETLADPLGAALRFVAGLEAAPVAEARALAEAIRGVCPTSVAIALGQLARIRGAGLDLAAVLADDYRLLGRLMARGDFAEGVRAQLIDKDGEPRWRPNRLEDLDPEAAVSILDPRLTAEESPLAL